MAKDIISFARKLIYYKRAFNEIDAETNELIRKLSEEDNIDLDVLVCLEKRVSLISELAN